MWLFIKTNYCPPFHFLLPHEYSRCYIQYYIQVSYAYCNNPLSGNGPLHVMHMQQVAHTQNLLYMHGENSCTHAYGSVTHYIACFWSASRTHYSRLDHFCPLLMTSHLTMLCIIIPTSRLELTYRINKQLAR